jgi:hypothetical protein
VNRRETTRMAILDYLRSTKATPTAPLDLHHVTTSLVGSGFTQEEIVRALFSLYHDRVIELMDGNFVRVMHFMTIEEEEPSSPSFDV